MIEPKDYADLVNARWRLWRLGAWRPVTALFTPGRGGNVRSDDPLRASAAVVFMGEDDPEGDWNTIELEPGQIFSRTPSCAIPGISWHQGARLREALHGAPQPRETLS
jgi:hypothetical protein